MKPLVTIGLPVYNAMPFLPETVESLLNQTERCFEILAIDDGSTDDSLAYLRSVRDSRLRVVTQPNRGLTGTLNRMLAEANTPWLMRHDADDLAYPNRVKRTLEWVKKFPDAGMFYSSADYYSKAGRFARFRGSEGSPEELRETVRNGYLLSFCHPTATLSIEKTIKAGGYRFDLYAEDIDLWWRLALDYDIHFIPDVMVSVRPNSASISSQNFRAQVVNTLYIQYLLISHLNQRNALPYERVKGALSELLNERNLRFRQAIRRVNILASERRYMAAVPQIALAMLASPADFAGRVVHELLRPAGFQVGQDPVAFMANPLWTSA